MLANAKAWQNRPLEAVYAIVYLDCLVIKIRDGGAVRNHACYVAIGVNCDGERDVLGLWFQPTEGARATRTAGGRGPVRGPQRRRPLGANGP